MSRLGPALAARLGGGGRALVPFVTAGDPSLAVTERIVRTLADEGADAVELGVPFSDPLADGPTIQESSVRALASGTTLAGILDLVERLRRHVDVPLVLMGYANPFRAMGAAAFARRAAAVGADGVIVPDLPPEEGEGFLGEVARRGIDPILLVAPTTPLERARRIARLTRGFLYYVSLTGVTGERAAVPDDVRKRVAELRRIARLPVLVGFGVSTPEHAATLARVADGVIVGSAIVRRIPGPGGAAGAARRVGTFVRALRRAIDER